MFGLSLVDIRHQGRFMVHVVARDLPKRVASAAMMMGICWWAGERLAAAIMLVLVLASEAEAKILARRLPENDQDITVGFLATLWITNWFSTVVYLVPAVALAHQSSVPLLLSGYIWLFGVFVYVSNTFVFLPFFNWTLMIPAFGTAFVVFSVASSTSFTHNQRIDWIVAAGLMVVYVFNTIETIGSQKDTHRALRTAREEADTRLRQLEHLTRHDALTGVLNRRAFDEGLAALLTGPGRRGRTAVLMIDLDGFKPINDCYGHAAGDAVLREVAQRLDMLAGEAGIVARVGGDEFAIAAPDILGRRHAISFAAEVARLTAKPIEYGGRELAVTASIGVALEQGQSAEALGAEADQAMFHAKATLQGGAVLFDPREAERRPDMDIKMRLAEAIRAGALRTGYLPRIALTDGGLAGAEVAPFWDDNPLDGQSTLYELVTSLGLQGDYLAWLARAAMVEVTALVEAGIDPGRVTIRVPEMALATVSGRAEIERLMRLFPQARPHMTLSVPEAALAARAGDAARQGVTRLRQLGLRVALGGFGAGPASFDHLRRLEIDEMALDGSITARVGDDARARVLAAGILSIADGLGLATVAEGVGDDRQLRMLADLGCQFAQGPHLGGAIDIGQFASLLRAGRQPIRA